MIGDVRIEDMDSTGLCQLIIVDPTRSQHSTQAVVFGQEIRVLSEILAKQF